ncbi:MAG: hypothetical protein M5U28_03620 [Sandaracinaceae bacterium]|nr:hypothetical protein [Sandaracinaceae bacterium]
MGTRPGRVARGVAVGLGVALLTVAALLAGLALHANTAVGLAAAEHLVEWSGSETSRGTVRVGRVRSVPPRQLSLLDYRIIAPDGEVVIASDEIAGVPDWSGVLDGQVRFRPSRFVRARIRLTPGPDGQVNLVHASEVPDERFTIPLVFEDIRLIDNTIHVSLPGKPAVTMRRVHGRADLHIGHLWEWRLRDNRGEIDLPIVEPGFRRMNGRLKSDSAHPLVVRMEVDAGPIETSLSLDYHVPALAGEEGEPYLDLDLEEGEDEEEEAHEELSEAREEREEVERALREAERAGDEEETRELRQALEEHRRAERRAREQVRG